jgi:hypothetical protein
MNRNPLASPPSPTGSIASPIASPSQSPLAPQMRRPAAPSFPTAASPLTALNQRVRSDSLAAPGPLGHPPPRRDPDAPARADLQQAGYVLARQLTGRALRPAVLALTWEGNETRKRVYNELPFGRTNVTDDLRLTGFARLQDNLAARAAIRERTTADPRFAAVKHVAAAALAVSTGGGNCYEMTTVGGFLHAHKLEPTQQLLGQRAEGVDHGWLRLQSAAPKGVPPSWGAAAIIDPWQEGPVVDAGDTDLHQGLRGPLRTFMRIDGTKAALAARAFEAAGESLPRDSERLINQLKGERTHASVPYGLREPEPLLPAAFARLARERADETPPEVLLTLAANALLSAPARYTREQAQAYAHEVVAFARDLRQPLSRPLIQPPDDSHFMFRPIAPNDVPPPEEESALGSPR